MTVMKEHSGSVLDSFAAARERFLEAARVLGARPGVRSATSGIDCRAYEDGTCVELWVEADLGGRVVCWWLEARRPHLTWMVEATVLENRSDREGQEHLREFAIRPAADEVELREVLTVSADELLATASAGDFLTSAG
jgi:hypothetical protein